MIGAALYLMQDSALFFPDNLPFDDCNRFPLGTDAIEFNGERFFYKNNSDTLVIFYHGNAASGCAWDFMGEIFDDKNLSYIISVYPGFSGDERSPSVENVKEYVEVLEKFAEQYDTVKLIGYSIGTGAAAYHSTLGDYKDLFFISSFPNIAEIARLQYPLYPVRHMLRDDFNIADYLHNFDGRVVQIHGKNDRIVPLKVGKMLFDLIGSDDKEFVEINQDHNTMFSDIVLFEELAEFLER